MARSKKSGRPKGYAFLEFTDKEVAEIAVQTMNGYMMFHKQIECHLVDAAHKDTFKHGNRDWKFIPTQVMFRNKFNTEKTTEQRAARVEGLLGKEKEKRIRLKELGIEYDFPGYQAVVGSSSKKPKAEKKRRDSGESVEKPKKSSRKNSEEVTEKPRRSSRNAPEEEEAKPRKSSRNKEPVEEPKKSKKSKSKK